MSLLNPSTPTPTTTISIPPTPQNPPPPPPQPQPPPPPNPPPPIRSPKNPQQPQTLPLSHPNPQNPQHQQFLQNAQLQHFQQKQHQLRPHPPPPPQYQPISDGYQPRISMQPRGMQVFTSRPGGTFAGFPVSPMETQQFQHMVVQQQQIQIQKQLMEQRMHSGGGGGGGGGGKMGMGMPSLGQLLMGGGGVRPTAGGGQQAQGWQQFRNNGGGGGGNDGMPLSNGSGTSVAGHLKQPQKAALHPSLAPASAPSPSPASAPSPSPLLAPEEHASENIITVRDRKIAVSDNTSLYALCRSWVRNGLPQENQAHILEPSTNHPRPLPSSLEEDSHNQEVNEDDEVQKKDNKEVAEENEEAVGFVEHLSAQDLLQGHIKRAKRIRARLREERHKRILRHKKRLALIFHVE